MIRHIIFLFAFLFFALELALAQVAAPRLLPGFVTENPAVIQLGGPSRIGVARFDTEGEITNASTTPATVTDAESSGTLAGLRLVGDSISFAAQAFNLEGTEGSTLKLDLSFTSVALAIPIGDSLTLGAGQEKADFKFESTFPATLEFESSTNLVGVTLRLGGVFFLGAAFGNETLNVKQTVPAVPVQNFDADFEREHKRYGAAIYDNEGVKWHLEYAVMSKGSDQDDATGISIGKSEEKTGIIEVNAGGFLLSFRSKTLEEFDESVLPTVVSVTEETKEINLGWVPESGWALAVAVSETERDEPSTNTTRKDSTIAVLLSFLF